MGDGLPPKRQTVVERLRRRMGLYRLHQGSCLPRYDQAANGIYDAQRHETMLLKQRFLEAKAKKTKRTDNRRDNTSNLSSANNDAKNGLVVQPKLKRAAGSPLLDCAIDGISDNHQNKIPRNSTPEHHNNSNGNQSQQQQSGMPSFSVQIVQQFTSSNTSQAPHSQTIQTNVTVQALSSGAIKTSSSPMTSSTVTATASPGNTSDMSNVLHSNPGSVNNGSSTSISVGTNIECKREPDVNFAPCSMSSSHPMNDLSNDLSSGHNENATANGTSAANSTQTAGANLGDRFSDSLANLGFPEDSSDDVIHPDILKDIIDDVFTNPSDLINGFSFVDNLKDNSSNAICQNVVEGKDSMNGKTSIHPHSQAHFQSTSTPVVSQFSASQTQQAVFDFQNSSSMNTNSSALTANSVTGSQGFSQNRMTPYTATSPNIPSISNSNSGLGLDFKLTEPSPAAQTLKQMAEQHQNMQQKQQQMGLAMAAHPRSPFRSDSFTDPLSSIRSNFLNGGPQTVNTLQKSPNNLFQNVPYNQQQNFSGTTGGTVKQEVGSPVPPIYTGMTSSSVPLSDLELQKRRQQILQMQQQQQQQPRPPFSQSPDQKPLGISGTTSYSTSRPLTHYNDAVSSHGSASNSPISHTGQFMRGVSTPGVTPPPNFSPSPSGTTLHLSQSQQLQISQNNQQLQVSQSQQQLMVSHDLKPTISPKPQQQQQQQQQQHIQARSFYPGHHSSSVQMSQSQSVSFQFGASSGNRSSPNQVQRSQQSSAANNAVQRQMQQYACNRQPPEYQSPMEPNSVKHQMGHHLQLNAADSRSSNQRGRKSVSSVVSSQGYVHVDQTAAGSQSANSLLMSGANHTSSGRGRGARGSSRANAASSKTSYPRHQRPPNVNVGPEGLNISQRPPVTTDWRHIYMQQQQQINSNLQIRIPYPRAMPGNMAQNVNVPVSHYGGVNLDPNSNSSSSNSSNALNCLPSSRDMMGNTISQIGNSTLTMPAGIPNANSSGNTHLLMQQQQAVIQCSGNANANMHNPQLQMPGNMQVRDPNNLQQPPPTQQQHGFANSPKPVVKQLDDTSQGLSSDGNQFLLDFLDNIDYSTSDLLNFDVMHGGGSSFPLLDDMGGMLGK